MTALDHLTGIYNRRFLEDAFQKGIQREQRRKEGAEAEVALLFVDVDNFKAINTTYGYFEGGDIILKIMGEYLKKEARTTDVVGRVGGDEFLIICPNTSVENATIFAERLRRGVMENKNIKSFLASRTDVGDPLQNITISIGAIGYRIPFYGEEIPIRDVYKEMANKADKALKSAKGVGKNRVHEIGYLV